MVTLSIAQRAGFALVLVMSLASGGLLIRFWLPGTFGQVLFITTRLLMLSLPLFWFRVIEQRRFQWSYPSVSALRGGVILGLFMLGGILLAYGGWGQNLIDRAIAQAAVERLGLLTIPAYLAFAVYFTVVNAFVEEYLWRWFVYRQWEVLVTSQWAIAAAALSFTVHHIIALIGYTQNWTVTLLGSLGVFFAGVVWCWCYLHYRSLWPCYISHAFADLAIALVGWHLLFPA